MKNFAVIFFVIFVFQHSVDAAVTEAPDDDDDWEDTSSGPAVSGGPQEADDDGRVYKNPRNSPSAVCPRDEEQATLLGQKCLRKCSSDEDCKSKKKKCLCDGACGMSCIKPDRECPELDKPELGDVTVSGRLFGDKALYSCPHGYHVVGLQGRNCQADGQWAGQAPACKQNIYCLTPPHIEHARHSALPEQATFDLDATIQYHCHTGYVTNGFPRAKCLAIEGQASWYGPDITCEPRSCGPPGELPHGWVTAECHTFGCRAALHCGAGFELVGRAERFCQSDGTWAPNELPTCVLVTAVQCPTPDAPRHGRAIYTSCAYNSIVSYECKYGYRLIGDNTRRCGADKKWSGTQPVCKEINCGHPGRLYNGWLENIEAGTGLGASIIFRCHDGMRMEGNSSTVCQLDGTWRYPLPKCLAPCVVPHVTQGKVILVPSNITQDTNETTPSSAPTTQIIGSSTVVHHGDALIVECEKNYEFPSNTPAVTCNNGTWTQIIKCQPARCKRLPRPPKNGMVIAPKTDHGMRARFHCKDGFTLKGPEMLLCSFGNWTGEMPICQEVYCPFPGYIENGKVLLVGNMGLYDYRPYVKKVVNNKQIMYDCDKGYVLSEGPPGATCIGGHWSPKELPSCTPGQHPRLRWSRRRRRSAELNRRRYLRAKFLKKYYDYLRKRSVEIANYQNLIKNYDNYKSLDNLIHSGAGLMPGPNVEKKYVIENEPNNHVRRKRQIDTIKQNKIVRSKFSKLFRLLRKRSLAMKHPYNINLRKLRGYNFFGLHPRVKRDARNRYGNLNNNQFISHKTDKRHIDILPFRQETDDSHNIIKRSIDILPLTDEFISHKIGKRHIDILPFDEEADSSHKIVKRSIDILPFTNEFISHKIGKRHIDILPFDEEADSSHKIVKRSIDILPLTNEFISHKIGKRHIDILPFDEEADSSHKIVKRSIDILPLTNEFISHKIGKRQIDILPYDEKNEDSRIREKRSIDILPISNEHNIRRRQIDILPLSEDSSTVNKRSIDILPFVGGQDSHTIERRSIDILPLTNEHSISNGRIDILPFDDSANLHTINKRSIDILPFGEEIDDRHNMEKRLIDILPLSNNHEIRKRQIDILPVDNSANVHTIKKRLIDVLPLANEHTINNGRIDILPFVEDSANHHTINKRSIDILPLTDEFTNHNIGKRHIDILPFGKEIDDRHNMKKRSIDILPLTNEHSISNGRIDILPFDDSANLHTINKRSIDILPLANELPIDIFPLNYDPSIKKRSIDILPLTDEFISHKIGKRQIDVLPFGEGVEENHSMKKRSIDILPLTDEFISHKIGKRQIDGLPFGEGVDENHSMKKRSIDILPLTNEFISHKIGKRQIDALPFVEDAVDSHLVEKRSIDIVPLTNNHNIKKRQIDILPLHYDSSNIHTVNKRAIDILPLTNEFISHKIGKHHIDILPFGEGAEDAHHSMKKKFIDILPLTQNRHLISKRQIDILPVKEKLKIRGNSELPSFDNRTPRSLLDVGENLSDNIVFNKKTMDILHKIEKRHTDLLSNSSFLKDVKTDKQNYSFLHSDKSDFTNIHSINFLGPKKPKTTLAKRDVNGIKTSVTFKKYLEMKKQWEKEMAGKKVEKKTENMKNVNFQENPPLKVDPIENKINKNRGKFKDLPRVSAEEMIKRMKRTSRKTERLNQTTASVPKSNKDNKNRQSLPSPDAYSAPTAASAADVTFGEERGRGKGRVKGPCEPISSEPYVNVEVVKFGRDPNITYSSGTIVRVACGKGYGLNLGHNSTAKCVRGRWKPMKPVCEILPCHIPVTENGIFTLSPSDTGDTDTETPLNETMDIENGQVVQFSCEPGYNVQGASNLRCWHGDWAVTSMPECVPAPCELPVVAHGVYSSGYRPGLTTAHGSAVTLHCERGYAPPAVLQCSLGEIRVRPPEPCQSIEGNISSIREGQDFRGGSDIVSEDFDELEYPTSSSSTDCGPPARIQGTLIYRDGGPTNTSSTPHRYPHGTEVTFRCIAAIMGERSTWKILCDKGKWVGKSVSCEEEDLIPAGLLTNATCSFRNNEANVVSFYNDLEIKEEVVEFPAGAVLVSRCVDIGKYAMIGPKQRKCVGGEWDGSKPSCFGLNQENDYAIQKPPTILFRHELGPIMQSNDGKLIVYPGTILHMECLWMRKFGNPKWNVSHEYRKYPEGWSSDPGRDSYLEYRISIFHAVQDDSGVFTCITPARQSHEVEILVEAVHCPPLPMRRGLISSSQSTKMGSEVAFSCANGNSLIGAAKIMCLPSGNWSAPLPLCESVECGEVALSSSGTPNSRPRVSIVSRGVGGRAAFSCSSGWGLKGPAEIVCSPSGEWTPAPPVCIEVSCPPPAAPVNGYLLGKAPFRAGDIVQFNCNPAHMMQGQPIVACQDNARWSGDTPKCIQACSYPGTTISGRMSSVKFYYKIGETISFTCEPGLVLRGAPMLRCLRNGKWSNAIPICSRDSSGDESNISGNDSDQLLNDAPILSEHHIITNTDNRSSSPLLERTSSSAPMKQQKFYTKSQQLLSFPGLTVSVSDIMTPTPTQPLIVKKPEMRAKLRKSKTYYKINEDILASLSSALPTVVDLLKKTTIESAPTEITAATSNMHTTEATITVENTTLPIVDAMTNISTDEVSLTSVTEAFVDETTEQHTTGFIANMSTESSNFEETTVDSVESSFSQEFEDITSPIPTESIELIFSTSAYSTASSEDLSHSSKENFETTTSNNFKSNRKGSLKKMPKNCTEDEEESNSSEGNNLTKEYELLSTAHTPVENLKSKNKSKVSLDLLSLFQEIDKIENKDNTTMYGRSSSKKKDLSHIEPASNAEIDHIKKQLGIDTNSKRKPINR